MLWRTVMAMGDVSDPRECGSFRGNFDPIRALAEIDKRSGRKLIYYP
jgi:hypothetical protein